VSRPKVLQLDPRANSGVTGHRRDSPSRSPAGSVCLCDAIGTRPAFARLTCHRRPMGIGSTKDPARGHLRQVHHYGSDGECIWTRWHCILDIADSAQTVVLLTRYDMHRAAQTSSWLLHGLATRMGVVLKINQETPSGPDISRLQPSAQSLARIGAETRRRLAWAVFVQDSFINGKSCLAKQAN
jgi:hypothetical protein